MALDSCLKQDTFISLPTGFGKSAIFQCAPVCHDFMRGTENTCHKSLVIVILPLKSLALDQMDRAKELGLEAGLVMNDFIEDGTENLSTGMYSILFASPEVLLSTKGREALQVGQVYDRICGIFVDESHCVVKWGHSSGHTNAFRKFYGMLAELRSVIKPSTPLIAITATATTQVRAAIVKSLGMHNVALIHASPTVDNIKHVVVETRLKDPSEIFSWLCEDLKQKHGKMERVIIFCQSRKDCSELNIQQPSSNSLLEIFQHVSH
ncbi:Bloom syndrome protein [Holothuria leucospilota]|uniref:Bloom syndrome protein n=1 Tax=Holothuria leucospilota TaxID=206669 RepID=A0A9Q1C8L9_HOLLE|nr:Bloom syndrome protein [Holothuria leucospilota]